MLTHRLSSSDASISAELCELYKTFQKCLNLREKYMTTSKQHFEDDPLNGPDWEIYPNEDLPASEFDFEEARKSKIPGAHTVSILKLLCT